MNLGTVAQLLGYELLSEQKTKPAIISIDSRTILPNSIYLALKGDRFDGHDFIKAAVERGAVAVICEKALPDVFVPQWVVPSCLDALAELATHHRQSIHCPVIALTGSNGKTSVKEMIASILPKPSRASEGNWNNHIGAPLSVLKLEPSDLYAVFELGANHPKEIAYTAAIVKPDVALINNIAPAHIEGFGSIDNVAHAKGEIYQALSGKGIAIINDDDDYAHFWDSILQGKQHRRFSMTKKVDVYADNLRFDAQHCGHFTLCLPSGTIAVSLKVPGQHSVRNALAAAAATDAVGIDKETIALGLNQFQGVRGRLSYLSGKNDSIVIDDTYNANLRSVLTAVDILGQCKGLRILVFGDMGELGDLTTLHHEEVGRAALDGGIDYLMTIGVHSVHASQAFGPKAKHYATHDLLAQDLLHFLDRNTTVLVKGSRSAGMEKVVHQLID